jgi:hypothetical protein
LRGIQPIGEETLGELSSGGIQRLNRRAFIGLVAGGFLAAARAAEAQPPFRLTFHRERDEPSSIVLAGELFNDGSRDVIDVWVTAEGLNVAGRVAVRGIAFVSALIPGRGSTAFTVKLARAEEVRTFRAFVSSFRYGLGIESP